LFGIAEIELPHARERQAAGIALACKRSVYSGRRPGTTKAAPSRKSPRRSALKSARYNYLSNGR
jgi:DNA invertase Pin-like site-specific DNA recombinase